MPDKHISHLPVNQLQANPLQPRGKIMKDDLAELVTSIKQYGVLEPILVAQTPAGYQIIAGERRWRASKEAGLEEVPVVVKITTPRGMLEMAIIENVQRVDLSAIERAQAFQQLSRDFKFSQTQIAERIGKSVGYVNNTLRLLQLPDAIKDGVSGGQITEGHARALAGIEDEKLMIECYKILLRENASVRRAEELARKYKAKAGQQVRDNGGRKLLQADLVEKWQSALQSLFSDRAKIEMARSVRQTKITIILKGNPDDTQAELDKILSLTKK
jgi:ParB family transcriptional regulator, chromosome partitioning protein